MHNTAARGTKPEVDKDSRVVFIKAKTDQDKIVELLGKIFGKEPSSCDSVIYCQTECPFQGDTLLDCYGWNFSACELLEELYHHTIRGKYRTELEKIEM